MGKQFSEGRLYFASGESVTPIRVLRRTEKSVFVGKWSKGRWFEWRMLIKHDDNGNEYVADSSTTPKRRSMYVYRAIWEAVE